MSTTPEQKAMILDLWRTLREGRGMEADVVKRIKWNWPSLSTEEMASVLDAYNRRVAMKRPSSPRRVPKHHIKCELGVRHYTEVFESTRAAKVFLDELLDGEKFKWEREDIISAKGGVLRIQCDELEQIVEFDADGEDYKTPEPISQQIHAFLKGHWPHSKGDLIERSNEEAETRKTRPSRDGLITIGSICDDNKWDARDVRMAMRKAGWDKPEAGWAWSSKEAESIVKKLSKLMLQK